MTKQLESWTPHEYQLRAIKMMLGQGAVGLFLDPGLGKTSICLAALRVLKRLGYVKKTLIIAPLRPAYSVWPGEVYKWEEFQEFSYVVLHGPEKDSRLWEDVDLYIINPEGLQWLASQKSLPTWECLIVDESTKFKDSGTKRFKALKKLLPTFNRRWILTGTPMPNTLMDLFGQIYILDMGRALGRYVTHFRMEFFQKLGYNAWEWRPSPGAFERVVERISALVLQLRAEDYLKMPELVFHNVEVPLPESVLKIYQEVEDEFITVLETEETITAGNAAAAGTKCRQIANGAVYVGDSFSVVHDEKLDALEDLLEELAGHPVLLLYEFQHDRDRILNRFPYCTDVKTGDIADIVTRFNAGSIPVLLGHPASMGHGLNLQGSCHHVIWFGITWNFEHYDQAIRRVYRQGQKSVICRVYHLIAKDTLDEKVLKVLGKKERQQGDLLNAISEARRSSVG
jgi:SNF2 family DNA or RNA helicase